MVPDRWYTSIELSVSALTSDSLVVNITRLPSPEARAKFAPRGPLPPFGPIERSVVVMPLRSYTSVAASVSELTSDSLVSKNASFPSCEAPLKNASGLPLPPAGPLDTTSRTLWLARAAPGRAASASATSRQDCCSKVRRTAFTLLPCRLLSYASTERAVPREPRSRGTGAVLADPTVRTSWYRSRSNPVPAACP